jgi:hypothetical protein
MYGMSVNDVPGWLVAIVPRAIGVPVAFTPGLVPHCDVFTDAAFAELTGEFVLVLLQPAATIAAAAASATAAHARGA